MEKSKLYAAGLRDGVPDIHELQRAMDDCFEGAALGTDRGYKTFHVGTNNECSNIFDIMDAIRANPWYQKFNQPGEILEIRDVAYLMLSQPTKKPYEFVEDARKSKSKNLWAVEVAAQVVRDIEKKHAKEQHDSDEMRLYLLNTTESRAISNSRPD